MTELTAQEQAHVRTALRFLRTRTGGWDALANVLHFNRHTLRGVMKGQQGAGAGLAVRVARLVGASVDDVLAGKYPAPGTCPYCGHRPPDGPTTEAAR